MGYDELGLTNISRRAESTCMIDEYGSVSTADLLLESLTESLLGHFRKRIHRRTIFFPECSLPLLDLCCPLSPLSSLFLLPFEPVCVPLGDPEVARKRRSVFERFDKGGGGTDDRSPFPKAIPAAHQSLVVGLHESIVSLFSECLIALPFHAFLFEHSRFTDLLWTDHVFDSVFILGALPFSLPLKFSRTSFLRFFLRKHAVRLGGK